MSVLALLASGRSTILEDVNSRVQRDGVVALADSRQLNEHAQRRSSAVVNKGISATIL